MAKKQIYHFCFVLLLLAFASGSSLLSQNGNDQLFSNLKVKDGLPSNEIYAVTQDSLGFMWFATNNGFVRYDGYEMKVYRKNRSSNLTSSNNQNTCIANGKDLGMWVGSYEGLIHFDSKTSHSKAIDLGGIREIRCLLNQGDSIIWAGSSEGLFKIDAATQSYQRYTAQNSTLGSNIVRALFLDHKQTLWIGTFDGINYLKPTGEMKHFDLKGDYKPELKNNLVLDIEAFSEKTDSILWIGTETGLVAFNQSSETYQVYNSMNTRFENEVVKCIFTQQPGSVYLGTDFGFYFLNTLTGESQHLFHDPFNTYSISNNVVWDIYKDNAGILWLATSNGISKLNFNQSMFRFTPVYSSKESEVIGTQVNDIYSDADGTIWLATKKGVVARYKNGEQQNFTANEKSKNRLVLNNINTISGDYLGRIWIGSAGGINVWDPKLKKMYTITANFDLNKGLRSNYIGGFIAPSNGSFWVTTWGGGMYKAKGDFSNLNDINFEYVANFNTNVFSANKKIWLKNENKVFSFDLNTGEIQTSSKLNSHISTESVSSLQVSSKGILWIGAHNLLISYNIQNEEITDYNVFTGNDSYILNLLEDHSGNIWGTTLTSIFKFNTNSHTIETFPKNEGIPLDNFLNESKAISPDGQLFFGGNDGFISFNPEAIKKNKFQPNVAITDLRVNNKTINSLSELGILNRTNNLISYYNKVILKYDQHSFTVGFSALHFGESERNIYAYRLEGFDDEWNYTTGLRNFASYSNLKSGKYLFKVKATNNDGVWSDNETTLQLIVKPPSWASPVAIILYILILQMAIFALVYTYRNKIKWKEQLRIITLEKEKNEELAKAKQQFFTNISHEFRTPLSLIIGPANSMLKRNQVESHDRQLLTLISKNAQRLFSLVNQLLDLRKIETNTLKLKLEESNIVELCEKQFNLFVDLAETHQINYRMEASSKQINAVTDVIKLESIVQNLLSNAFKYTPDQGTILVQIEISLSNTFLIKVVDNGKGIAPEIKENVFTRFYQGDPQNAHTPGYGIGLNMAKEYSELMQGKIWFDSELGKGTNFYVELPLNMGEIELSESPVKEVRIDVPVKKEEKITIQTNGLPLILLVDDQPDTIALLKLNLSADYSIISAHNGKMALELLEKYDVSLIISDIMMPVLNGIEFCIQVKNHPRFNHIPVILLTARTIESQMAEGYRAGTDAYLTKPFDMDVLTAQIESLLEKNRRTDDYIKRKMIVENQEVNVESADEKLLQETIQYINKHINDPEINLVAMCKFIGVSHSSLYRKIKAQTGMTLNELIRNIKLKRAAQLIKTGKLSIAEIMDETGFTNHSYFAKCFKKVYKVSPKEYK
ncbi:MAG: ATP-binding protein [Prolixibacteraceae bacterium]